VTREGRLPNPAGQALAFRLVLALAEYYEAAYELCWRDLLEADRDVLIDGLIAAAGVLAGEMNRSANRAERVEGTELFVQDQGRDVAERRVVPRSLG
jgi:hypothetical protein